MSDNGDTPLTHEERMALIERPFFVHRYGQAGARWRGAPPLDTEGFEDLLSHRGRIPSLSQIEGEWE